MRKRNGLAVALAVTMLLGQVVSMNASAASATNNSTSNNSAIHTVSSLSPIKISSSSLIRISNVNILSGNDQNVLTYTLTYQNNGGSSISLMDYWTKVKTNKGATYAVTPVSQDKDKKQVLPGTSLSVTYTAQLPKSLQYYDLNFEVIKWDFAQVNYEDTLGSFKIPSSYTIATPINYTQDLNTANTVAKVKISSVDAIANNNVNYLNVALNVENAGNKQLQNGNWKYVIQTMSGTVFALTPDSSSTSLDIPAMGNKTLNLVAKIPNQVSLNNLKLIVVQTDDTTKTDYPLGTFKVNYVNPGKSVVGTNGTKKFNIDNGVITTQILNATSNQANNQTSLSIKFLVENSGNKELDVPSYTFEALANGSYYPLVSDASSGVSLNPGESVIINLDTTIPTVNVQKGVKLYMNTPLISSTPASTDNNTSTNTDSEVYPLAVFAVPEAIGLQNILGIEQQVKNNLGTFGLTLDSVQLLPWEESPLLISRITIRNEGSAAVQLPDFTGLYKVDLASLDASTQLITTNSTKVLAPNGQTDVYIVANVPVDLDLNQLQIQLLQKISNEKTSSWIQFTHLGELSDLNEIKSGSSYELGTTGKDANLVERKTYEYEGVSSNILYTELVMTNLGNSQTNMSQLIGYYKTHDGQYYKADVTQIDHAASPKSNNVVTFSTKLPKSVSTSDMQLIVGEGTSDGKLTNVGKESTGFVNAVAVDLSLDKRDIQNSLENIELFPYELNINNFQAFTSSSGLQINFKYDLTRDLKYDMGQFGHKFVLEVTDSSGARFEKEIELEKDFLIGDNQNYSFTISDPIFETSRTGAFQFSVYDEFLGEKTKIASQAQYYTNSRLND